MSLGLYNIVVLLPYCLTLVMIVSGLDFSWALWSAAMFLVWEELVSLVICETDVAISPHNTGLFRNTGGYGLSLVLNCKANDEALLEILLEIFLQRSW